MKRITVGLIILVNLILSSCTQSVDPGVKNIIVMIGDGMGVAHVTAGRLALAGPGGQITLDQMPVTGLVRTHSADNLVTDSAASATAIATGTKTSNGTIGMTVSNDTLVTFFELAKQKGYKTGLVATSSITHATPAAFASHVPSRSMQTVIAEQLIKNRIDVLLGGGKGYFIPATQPSSMREDEKDLLALARDAGYHVMDELNKSATGSSKMILGLFDMGALSLDQPHPSLTSMTHTALEHLSTNDNGFLLMVEGSQIDWASHDHELEEMLNHFVSFEAAVSSALEFAKKDGQTLLLVTADHETGGLALNGGHLNGDSLKAGWTTGGHTGTDIPLYAFGPGANRFSGTMDNTDIGKRIAELIGLESFPMKK